MAITASIGVNVSVNGTNFAESQSISGDVIQKTVVSVPAAQDGHLTTRTDGANGTITMTSGSHTIITGQRIDIYWAGGYCYGATVGTVSTTSVPFTTASGTSLPIATTAVFVATPVQRTLSFAGNDLAMLVAFCSNTAQIVYMDSTTVELYQPEIGGIVSPWYSASGVTNPLAGDTVTTVYVSHGDDSAAHTVTVVALLNT